MALELDVRGEVMAEYIEREATIELLRSLGSRDYRREKGTIQDAIKMVSFSEYTPAADVAPAVHGRWIEPSRLYYGAKQYECSLCYSDTFWDKHSIYEKYPHCPNCGCRMDGGDDE